MITKISEESKESIVKKMLTKHFYDLNRRISSPLPDNLIEKIIDDSMIDMHWIKSNPSTFCAEEDIYSMLDADSTFFTEALEFFTESSGVFSPKHSLSNIKSAVKSLASVTEGWCNNRDYWKGVLDIINQHDSYTTPASGRITSYTRDVDVRYAVEVLMDDFFSSSEYCDCRDVLEQAIYCSGLNTADDIERFTVSLSLITKDQNYDSERLVLLLMSPIIDWQSVGFELLSKLIPLTFYALVDEAEYKQKTMGSSLYDFFNSMLTKLNLKSYIPISEGDKKEIIYEISRYCNRVQLTASDKSMIFDVAEKTGMMSNVLNTFAWEGTDRGSDYWHNFKDDLLEMEREAISCELEYSGLSEILKKYIYFILDIKPKQ